jgi:predicted ATPase
MVKAKNVVLFLDEPESGLSIRSQYRILESINKAKNNGCQIFIATHSAILINSVDKVLSLEHKKWMNSGDFICSQE